MKYFLGPFLNFNMIFLCISEINDNIFLFFYLTFFWFENTLYSAIFLQIMAPFYISYLLHDSTDSVLLEPPLFFMIPRICHETSLCYKSGNLISLFY